MSRNRASSFGRFGRSDWSSKLICGLRSKTAAGFRSRRGRCHEPTPVTAHYVSFASYETAGVFGLRHPLDHSSQHARPAGHRLGWQEHPRPDRPGGHGFGLGPGTVIAGLPEARELGVTLGSRAASGACRCPVNLGQRGRPAAGKRSANQSKSFAGPICPYRRRCFAGGSGSEAADRAR